MCFCCWRWRFNDAHIEYATWMVSLVIGYMVVTEVLSVIENLSDAGVDVLDKLIGKLKGRL